MSALTVRLRERGEPARFNGRVENAFEIVRTVLGLGVAPGDLALRQMAARAFVVFVFAVFLARVADRRILGHNAGFDIMLLVVLGSVLSRAINGEAAFFPTLGASAVLVGLHHIIASLALRSHWFSGLLKGKARTLVRDGKVDDQALGETKFTREDLDENLRLNGGVDDVAQVAEARLERNGTVSVVKARGAEK